LSKAAKWRGIHAGKVNVPVVFLSAVGFGFKLGPEHSQCPEAYFMHTPGLKLAMPSTPYDVKGLIKTAIRDDNPVVFFYNKALIGLTGEVPDEEYTVPFGVADVKREGTDVTVVATSQMVQHALAVAAELEGQVSVEVVDPRTLVPLDIDTIVKSVEKTGRVVIADEDTKTCGVTGEIGMQIVENAFDSLDAPPERVAMPDVPIPGGALESQIAPQPHDIRAAIEKVMG
jgi:pyruvate dehydrogenase E1 component beta subunit